MMRRIGNWTGSALTVLTTIAMSGCEGIDLTLPSVGQVEGYYTITAEWSAEVNGNVAELTVYQGTRQLSRGGTLWAKVGPYIYLFSEPTRDLLEAYPGLAGVRVTTRAPGGPLVASAVLARDALNSVTWRRALNVAGLARRDGSRRVGLLEDLVEWGEDHTEFEYSPRYVR